MGLFDFLKPKETAAKYLKSGISKHNTQDYDGALKDFIKATELDGDCVEAYFNKAKIYFILKNYILALVNLKIVIDLDPKNIDAYYNRGIVNLNLNFFDCAIDDFTIVIQHLPNDKAAIDFLEKSIMMKAVAEEFKDTNDNVSDLSKAMGDFDKVSNLKPNNWDSHFNSGLRSYQDDDYRNAFRDLKKVIENTPTNKEALVLFEKIRHILHTEKQENLDLLEPEEYYKKNSEGSPTEEEIARELGMTVNDIKGTFLYGPSLAKIRNKRAYKNYERGRFRSGIKCAKDAIRNNNLRSSDSLIKESNSIYLNTLALGYFYIGDYDKALTTIDKCLEIDLMSNSNNQEHFTTKAKIDLKLNNEDKSIKDLKRALDLSKILRKKFDDWNF